jgi:NhaA family Na+:H+ antiporter
VTNEGLMTVFFFLVGMEIKRELVVGELREWCAAVLPAISAVGGMVVPAAVFLLFTWGTPGRAGWGIPMATDIAFAVGCLSLLRSRLPHALVVFLMALAIFDDIGGMLVITVFYGHGVSAGWLVVSAAVMAAAYGANRAGARAPWLYFALTAALWFGLHEGGIHATIAGAVVGVIIPARLVRSRDASLPPDEDAPLARFTHALHPWVAFGIVPLFALVNAGVSLAGRGAVQVGGRVALGAAAGLVLGKPLGILAATALAVRAGIAQRPGGASWLQVLGVSIVAGIGFTVALFIAALAYPGDDALLDQAKVGILVGSGIAALVGILCLGVAPPTVSGAGAMPDAEGG